MQLSQLVLQMHYRNDLLFLRGSATTTSIRLKVVDVRLKQHKHDCARLRSRHATLLQIQGQTRHLHYKDKTLTCEFWVKFIESLDRYELILALVLEDTVNFTSYHKLCL